MKYLLDTNVCIRYLNGRSPQVRDQVERSHPDDLALCSIVKAELIYGALKSARPEKNLERARRFTDRFVSLPFDDAAALLYGEIRSTLEKAGTPIGPNDLMIASIARTHGVILVTHNLKEFSRVPGLELEDWDNPPE